MYRLTVEKEQFGDFIGLFLFDLLINEDFYSGSEDFEKLKDKLMNKGLRSILFDFYFKTDPSVRSKYKNWKRKFDTDDVAVVVSNDIKEETEIYHEIILECVKRITKKDEPNQEKVLLLTESILNDILGE